MTTNSEKKGLYDTDIIVLKNVFKFPRTTMEPCPDPMTGRYPDVVKRVDSNGDMILSEKDKSSGKIFIAENENIEIYEGKSFDLSDPYDNAWWEAIKNSKRIAMERSYKNAKGELVIDGNSERYGTAEFYVERPGKISKQKITKEKQKHEAKQHIFNDSNSGLYQRARLLGNRMEGLPVEDVQAYLLELAERKPEKINDVYTGGDVSLRILLMDAIDKKVIIFKGKQFYQYGETTVLGASQDSVILWMKNPANKRMLDMIKADTYPQLYEFPEPIVEDEAGDNKDTDVDKLEDDFKPSTSKTSSTTRKPASKTTAKK